MSWFQNGAEWIEEGEASENEGALRLMESRTRAGVHKDRGRVWAALRPPESAVALFGKEGLVPDIGGWVTRSRLKSVMFSCAEEGSWRWCQREQWIRKGTCVEVLGWW